MSIAVWIDEEAALLVQDVREGFASSGAKHAQSIELMVNSLHPDAQVTAVDVVEMTRDVVALCHLGARGIER